MSATLSRSRVETAVLDERCRLLDALLAGLDDCSALGRGLAPALASAAPERAGELAQLEGRLRMMREEAGRLRDSLAESAVAYERAEAEAAAPLPMVSVLTFAGRAGESLRRRAPDAIDDAARLVRAVADAAFGTAGAASRALAGDDTASDDFSEVGEELARELLGDPLVLEGIRATISTIGLGTEIGVLLLPPPVLEALGSPDPERFVGEGVPAAAGVLVALGTLFGVLPAPGERRLRLDRVDAPPLPLGSTSAAPTSWGELAARVPPSDPDGAQVVVEQYGEEWLVAVSGTTDWSADPEQAFGAASNLQAMSGGPAASVAGTLAAMEAAGVPDGAPVTVVAHSQGGLVALRVAQSGRYDVHDVVTFGSPVRGLDLPEGTRSVSIEHSDDVVPVLSGLGRTGAEEPGVVLVERRSPASTPQEGVTPAHGLDAYIATAEGLDAAPRLDPRLALTGAALFGLWRGAPDSRVATRVTTVPVSPRGARAAGGGRDR